MSEQDQSPLKKALTFSTWWLAALLASQTMSGSGSRIPPECSGVFWGAPSQGQQPVQQCTGGSFSTQHNSRQKKNVYPIECTLGRSSTIHVAFLKLNLCTCLDNWGFGKCLSKRLNISLDHSF